MKDCDPTTGIPDSDEGYDDEYMLEDFDVIVADQVKKTKVNNFTAAWDSADSDGKELVNISTSLVFNMFLILTLRMGGIGRDIPAGNCEHPSRSGSNHY